MQTAWSLGVGEEEQLENEQGEIAKEHFVYFSI